ncbi:MAG: hypothetical protein GKS06_04290 [Acidobacteria bacterium]|nr:hypothetical protein [Acidobacteriota bacterium]
MSDHQRIPFNLATFPVGRVRAARRVVALVSAAVVVLTLVHAGFYLWVSRAPAEMVVEAPAIEPEQLRAWQSEVDGLAAVADLDRARVAADAVVLGNELVGWRTIPWRAIFADLEDVLPDRVRLELVAPTLAQGGGIEVQMTAAATDTGPLQDLILALESHAAFVEVWPQREDAGVDEYTRLTLAARYVPRESTP